MKKGFVMSVDAIISLLIFFALFSATTFYLGQVKFEAKNSVLLKESAMDAITVLEKNGKLEEAVKTNKATQIRSFLNKLPNSLCAQIQIFGENDPANPLMTVLRPDCKKNFKETATFNRSFAVLNGATADNYVARITAWTRVSQ
ncbi:MAG: hypothetical protein HYW50_04720, partial [Candidatus Diapherotrites archaeon]|nr:hypothetical protein [Candidatus Diapherotrites archaeon]